MKNTRILTVALLAATAFSTWAASNREASRAWHCVKKTGKVAAEGTEKGAKAIGHAVRRVV